MQVKGMAHFCGFIKLIFLLLMLARIPCNETRPLKENAQANSDLIAGNEFLKLFMEHDHLERDLTSSEFIGSGSGGDNTAAEKTKRVAGTLKKDEQFDKKLTETGRRSSSSRSLKDKGPKLNQAEGQLEDSKQVVKLVTSGSKIVFLEDYDENDAILDAEVRDIDLKKEIFTQDNHPNLDEYKVVAVSVSSSSQRGTTATRNNFNKFEKRPSITSTTTTTSKPFVMAVPKKTTATTVRSQSSAASLSNEPLTKAENMAADNFINRSHKSEFSIEEVEPLTMTQQQARKNHARHRTYPRTNVADTMEALDSENSASTNIHNILAAPLQSSASARSTSTVTSIYHSGQRNMTINHHEPNLHVMQARHKTAMSANTENKPSNEGDLQQQQQLHTTSDGDGDVGGGVEDQLLPFQTVIYHDTKAGHGPQSRSISYSSISQNVEDLKKWQQSGILAEARRNVSESLKPMPKFNTTSTNEKLEAAKFYSQPSKMYSEPSKFYSEPAKVYSEPAKVYGEPEKFYSEPAKVYGQPSKFYSEPSKVYSQPAKVYSEPAKVYWPILSDTTTTTTNTNTITSTQSPSKIEPSTTAATTAAPTSINLKQSSKKPAIVSRIAFGEAHLISSSTSTTTTTTTTTAPLITTSRTYGSHSQHQYSSRTDISHRKPSTSSSSFSLNHQNSSLSSSSTSSRRILFNLDRLPYDLLNAPEPSIQQQQLLELQKTKRPQQTLTYQQQRQQQQEQAQQKQQQQPQHQQQQQQQKKQRHHINPCLESAVSSLFSSSTLSAHPTLQKQRQQQQHPSVPDQQQHSNQNAKGLPNGDLVKCVAEISHTSAADTDDDDDDDDSDDRVGGVEVLTTERNHLEELFAPTPERNYEIEESVSVMTNGRAHSVVGGGRNSFAHPTTSPIHQQQHHGFKPNRQRTRVHFGTSVNNPTEIRDDGHPHLPQLSQASYNTNANSNANTKSNNNNNNSNQRNHNAPEYNQYDDANNNDNNDSDNNNGNDGAAKNNDYEDDDGSPPANGNHGDGGSDEDSKVAYIVEGHNYRKYRVEEETDDGFIVGEYGVVDHNDGNLRGVRYTADSTINRSLIQKALLTFLKLK